MSDSNNPPKRTGSGIEVDGDAGKYAVTGTVTLSRKSMGMGRRRDQAPPPPPEKTAAPPEAEVAKMPYSVATARDVACPCGKERFEISPEFHNTVTECPSCKQVFVIRPPGTPPYKGPAVAGKSNSPAARSAASGPGAPPPKQTTTSGIQVDKEQGSDYGITGTVLLSREGMGMMQKKRGSRRPQRQKPPPPGARPQRPSAAATAAPVAEVSDEGIYSVATETDVGCPKCGERFEISPEFYGAEAECPDCAIEFVIKPPGTPPYKPGAAASPAPAAASADVAETATPAGAAEDQADTVAATPSKKPNPMVIGLLVAVILLLLILVIVLAVK